VTFLLGRFSDSGGNDNIQEIESFTVQGRLADLASPVNVIGNTVLNNRSYIDVALFVPVGHTLQAASVTDLEPEFALSGAGLGNCTIR